MTRECSAQSLPRHCRGEHNTLLDDASLFCYDLSFFLGASLKETLCSIRNSGGGALAGIFNGISAAISIDCCECLLSWCFVIYLTLFSTWSSPLMLSVLFSYLVSSLT